MHSEELRKYLDIINENSEEVLTEGMLQKLAGLALGTVLALGPKIGQADTVYTYFDPGANKMQTVLDMSKVPASAKTVMAVDTDTQQVMLVRSGSPTAKEITPDPVAVKQAQFTKDTKSFSDEPKQGQSQPSQMQIDFNNILDQAKNNLSQDFFDPESARFSGIKIYDTTTKKGDQIYLITGKVNAKNRMGGYVGSSDFYIALNKKDNSVVTKDTTDPSQGGQLWGSLLAGKYKNAMEKGTLVYNNGKPVNESSK